METEDLHKSIIKISDLKKIYRNDKSTLEREITVFNGFDLLVSNGEFLTIFGPNGCGKSTLLLILAGFVNYDDGIIEIDGNLPGKANVGFVFQNSEETLFPWKRNLDNVAWPLELQGIPKQKRISKAKQFFKEMNISIPEYGYPYQLSGGQQQLLSIARALILEPKVLLMDEPFNQLDFQTRLRMHIEIMNIWSRINTTVLFISHDIEEAILLGDRTIILSKRPTFISQILDNPLPRPRNHDMLKSKEFFNLKSKALEAFNEVIKE